MADKILDLIFARKDVKNFWLNTITGQYEIVFKNGYIKKFTSIKSLSEWLQKNKLWLEN